jgi:hypothetical protein
MKTKDEIIDALFHALEEAQYALKTCDETENRHGGFVTWCDIDAVRDALSIVDDAFEEVKKADAEEDSKIEKLEAKNEMLLSALKSVFEQYSPLFDNNNDQQIEAYYNAKSAIAEVNE